MAIGKRWLASLLLFALASMRQVRQLLLGLPSMQLVTNEERSESNGTDIPDHLQKEAKQRQGKPITSKRQARQPKGCKVQRNADNTFSLLGSWTEDDTLAAFLDRQHQGVCGKGKYMYPYSLHGCCASKPNPPLSSVFCSELFSTAISKGNNPNSTTYTRKINSRNTIDDFLEAIDERTLLFLGGSISLQMFAAIGMALKANQIQFEQVDQSAQIRSLVLPTATIKLVQFYRLEDVNRTGLRRDLGNDSFDPRHIPDSFLIAAIRDADIVIANVGLHHWGIPEYHYRQLLHIQKLIEQENKARTANRNRNDICLLWRRTLPQHFATSHGSGQYGDRIANFSLYGCQPLTQPWKHPSDQALDRIRRKPLLVAASNSSSQVPVLDFTSILQDASRFHSKNKGDCSHFCYSPLIWSPILHLTAETIRHACQPPRTTSYKHLTVV